MPQESPQDPTAEQIVRLLERARGLEANGDRVGASELLAQASEAGSDEAAFRLGLIAERENLQTDADRYYRLASERGSCDAMFALGLRAEDKGHLIEAETWWRKAGELGHGGALLKLAYLKEEEGSESSAIDLYKDAAEKFDDLPYKDAWTPLPQWRIGQKTCSCDYSNTYGFPNKLMIARQAGFT